MSIGLGWQLRKGWPSAPIDLRALLSYTGKMERLSLTVDLEPSETLTYAAGIPVDDLLAVFVATNDLVTMSRGTLTNEIHTLTMSPEPSVGSTQLVSGLNISNAINWNDNAAAVKTAIEAAAHIGSGNVASATGGPFPSTPIVVTYGGALAGVNVDDWTSTMDDFAFDGVLNYVTTQQGGGGLSDTLTIVPALPLLWWSANPMGEDPPWTSDPSALTFTNQSSTRRTRVEFRALWRS